MDQRAMVALFGTLAVAVGIGLVAKYSQPWGGLLVAGGIGGWIALLGSRLPRWEVHDGFQESPPAELVTFMTSPNNESVLYVIDREA